MRLDSPYCDHPGLNLSWEVLEGLAKHNGPVAAPGWALDACDTAFPLELDRWPSLEAQVAALADDIAYDNHDIDDGVRSGFLEIDELLALDFVAGNWRAVERRFPGAPREALLRELVREQIGVMVNDLIETTRANLAGVGSIEEVRGAGRALAAFSPEIAAHERELKAFLYRRLYYHDEQLATAERARQVIAGLFAAYDQEPALLSAGWRQRLPAPEPERSRHIADFIAGMTDRYAIERYRGIFGKAPAGLSNVSSGAGSCWRGRPGWSGARSCSRGDRPVVVAGRAGAPRGAAAARRTARDARRRHRRLAGAGRGDRPRRGDLRARHDLEAGGQGRAGVPRGRPRPRAGVRPRGEAGRRGQFRAGLFGQAPIRTPRRSTCASKARSRRRSPRSGSAGSISCVPRLLRGARGERAARSSGWPCSPAR